MIGDFKMKYDTQRAASLLRWGSAHTKCGNPPLDLPDFMDDAAETLESSVPDYWVFIAIAEFVVIVVLGILLVEF